MLRTRQLKQAAIDDADDGLPPPDQHRIMDPLCDVDPFRRTPAWLPGRKVRLAHSPHFSAFQPPFGLGQKVFCPLGSRPRVRGSLVEPTRWVTRLQRCSTAGRCKRRSALAPSLRSPQAESRTRQAVRLLPGIQQTNGFTIRLVHLAAGEPPDPVPLGRELQASGGRAAAPRRPGRPQLQAHGQPFPHS